QLMVFASDLTFGLAPVVHRGEIMGIDKMTTLTMPPMHVVLDDFGEMETDNNSIVEATTVTEAVISSPTCADLANLELLLVPSSTSETPAPESSSRPASTSLTRDSSEPSPGYPFQLPSELNALLTKMSSKMADVKEDIDTSSSNHAFCHASLLGLKLSADKTPATLNAWWIAYSKTKGGDHDSFVDQFGSSIPRDHMDKLSAPWPNPSSPM
ncbi:hypothetical protein B5M09_010037, partial [Aphanomyces astaci]